MIEIRLTDIRKMLPEGWAAEVDEDGVIVVTAPEEFDADMPDLADKFISAIEQPLTLTYTLTTASVEVLAAAESAAAYATAISKRARGWGWVRTKTITRWHKLAWYWAD